MITVDHKGGRGGMSYDHSITEGVGGVQCIISQIIYTNEPKIDTNETIIYKNETKHSFNNIMRLKSDNMKANYTKNWSNYVQY